MKGLNEILEDIRFKKQQSEVSKSQKKSKREFVNFLKGAKMKASQSIPGMIVSIFVFSCLTQATTYYVATNGNDNSTGTLINPFKTINKAFKLVKPGDTICIRKGTYRECLEIGKDATDSKATKENLKITIKGYQNEKAIITSMRLTDHLWDWKHISGNIYSYSFPTPAIYPKADKVPNCSEDGIPLKLMTNENANGDESYLTGPGQWVRNVPSNINLPSTLYVWPQDSNNPGAHIEYAVFDQAYNSVNSTIYLHHKEAGKSFVDVNYITFENLTIEGGMYPILVGSDHIEIKNCTIGNCYGDAVKITAAYDKSFVAEFGLVKDCNIWHFGESGIDGTGADHWIFRKNKIHNSVSNRGDMPFNDKTNAIEIKYGIIGAIIEGNLIYDINSHSGGIFTLGDGSDSNEIQARGVIIKNNVIYDCNANSAVQMAATQNCGFHNNLVYNNKFCQAIILTRADFGFPNKNSRITENIFYNNSPLCNGYKWIFWEYGADSKRSIIDRNFEFDRNITSSSRGYDYSYFIANIKPSMSLTEMRKLGFERHSLTTIPTFVDITNHDFHSLPNSPQVDSGDPNAPTDPCVYNPYALDENDFDGKIRAYDGNKDNLNVVDMGPYEYGPLILNYTNGKSYVDIKSSLDKTISGDTLIIYPWTYVGNIVLPDNKKILLKGANISNWEVIGKTIIDCKGATDGIYFGPSINDDIELSGVTVYHATYPIRVYGSSPQIDHCIVLGGTSHNIFVTGNSAPDIDNCKIFGSGIGAITISGGTGMIANNWIYGNQDGIELWNLNDMALILNNTITRNRYKGIALYSGTVRPGVNNCIVWNNGDDLYNCNATYSCIQNNDSGIRNIHTNPLFVKADANDFHLSPSSPCIDVGDPDGNYSGQTDIDGQIRVINIAGKGDGNNDVDMGADEYNQ